MRTSHFSRFIQCFSSSFYLLLLAFSLTCFFSYSLVYASSHDNLLPINEQEPQKKTLRIGYQPERAFYATIGSVGQEGYGYEYMQKILYYAKEEYTAEYVPVSWSKGLEMLKNGELDLLPFANYSEERAKEYIYSKKPIVIEKPVLVSLKEENPHISADYRELQGKKICVYFFHSDYNTFLDFMNENDIYALLIKIPYTPIAKLKQEGEYDYILSSSLLLGHNIVSTVGLDNKPNYILGNKANPELMADINYAMNKLETNDLLFERKLFIKYYNSFAQKKEYLTDEQIELIQGNVFEVGVMDMKAPLSFITDEGKPAGGFVDILKLIAQRGHFNVNFHILEPYASESEISKYDFSLLPYISNTNAPLPISNVFASNPIVLLHGTEKHERGKYVIGTMEHFNLNYTFVSSFLSEQPDDYKEFHEVSALIKAFLSGEVDDAIITRAIFNTHYEDLSLYSVTNLGFEYNVTMSFAKDFSKEKIKIINTLLSQVDQATQDDMTTRNVALMTRHSAMYYFIQYWYIVLISFLLMGLIFLMIYRKSQKQKAYELKLATDVTPLTGLFTFQKFLTEARTFITKNPNHDLRIVTFDIDHFSFINEVFGFEIGSKILQQVSYHIKEIVKEISPIANYGGDDFVLVHFKYSKNQEELLNYFKMDKLHNSLEPLLGKHGNLSFSIGVYDIVDRNLNINYMIDCAQIACHKSKGIFGTHVEFFTEEMKQESIKQNQMLSLIKVALKEGEFELFYQPKFDIDQMHVVGAEALIRWFRDEKMIPPDKFIPIAEKHGLINELDYHVIELACKFISTHRKDCLPHISINISGFTIIKSELVDKLLEITKKYDVHPQTLDIEITETALVHNFDMAINQINDLRHHGFTISMDDFGTGVSSLNRLSQMPLDTIKLDRVFIIDALENKKSGIIVKKIIELAKDIGAKTVAEGIETEEQLNHLRDLSCEQGQGYFYARPMSEHVFLEYLSKC